MANNTSLPAPYVAGKITVPANTVVNLLDLIQQQVQVNCPGTCAEFMLTADTGNTGCHRYIGRSHGFAAEYQPLLG